MLAFAFARTVGIAAEASPPDDDRPDAHENLPAGLIPGDSPARSGERTTHLFEPPAVAEREGEASSPSGGQRRSRSSRTDTPSSSLDRDAALRTAILATQFVRGAKISAVAGTGSMEPVFGRDAYLLLEPAPYGALREGDIVTYQPAGARQPVVHRLVRKYGEKFEAKGDNNPQPDVGYVTRDNYRMRVFGIVYTSPDTPDRYAAPGMPGPPVSSPPEPPPAPGALIVQK
ncbi:MAG TPA: signal peptidase I [Opitutaceae bacterium]